MKAIVLLSGGQDSTTCLLIAQAWEEDIFPVCFSYNQLHSVEIEQAKKICQALNVREPVVLPIEALSLLGGGALTNSNISIALKANEKTGNQYAAERGLPSTVIPGRNLMFLTLAAAYGANIGCYRLYTGGCLADREGYPDCRLEFYNAAQDAISLALDEPSFRIITPLIDVSKAETFQIADSMDKLSVITELTHTCYRGEHVTKHDWGYGCGECPACKTRAQGWKEFKSFVK